MSAFILTGSEWREAGEVALIGVAFLFVVIFLIVAGVILGVMRKEGMLRRPKGRRR